MLLVLCTLLLPMVAGTEAARAQGRPAEKRIALVIGNARYAAMPLANPENDARLISANLRKLGFEVNEQLNLNVREFRRVLREFARRLQQEDSIAVLYYAGHGVQIDGRNYLLPTDVNLRDEEEVKDESVDIEELFLSRLDKARSKARIVILDACRDNPFAGKTRNIRAAGGLAEMGARGTLIAYASAPGAPAEDGPLGKNSVYTRNLAQEMMVPGLEVEQMFKNVRVNVLRDTRQRQVPWVNTSLTSNFSFNPHAGPSPEEAARQAQIRKLEAELQQTRKALEESRAAIRAAAAGAAATATATANTNTNTNANAKFKANASSPPPLPALPPALAPPSPAPPSNTAASTSGRPPPKPAAHAPTAAATTAPAAVAAAPAAAVEAAKANELHASRLEAQLERARQALAAVRAESRAAAAARPAPPPAPQNAAADQRVGGERQSNCRDLLSRASIGERLSAPEIAFLKAECK